MFQNSFVDNVDYVYVLKFTQVLKIYNFMNSTPNISVTWSTGKVGSSTLLNTCNCEMLVSIIQVQN